MNSKRDVSCQFKLMVLKRHNVQSCPRSFVFFSASIRDQTKVLNRSKKQLKSPPWTKDLRISPAFRADIRHAMPCTPATTSKKENATGSTCLSGGRQEVLSLRLHRRRCARLGFLSQSLLAVWGCSNLITYLPAFQDHTASPPAAEPSQKDLSGNFPPKAFKKFYESKVDGSSKQQVGSV